MTDPRHLQHQLKALDPYPQGIPDSETSRSQLEAIGRFARAEPRPRPPKRGRTATVLAVKRGFALLSILSALGASGVAAAAAIYTTFTGQHAAGWQIKAAGPGEFLRVGAPGFCAAVRSLTSTIPYPPGYNSWRTWALVSDVGAKGITLHTLCDSSEAQHAADSGTGFVEVTTGAEQAWFIQSAFCAWTEYWVRAEANGETARATDAATRISEARNWTASARPKSQAAADSISATLGWFTPFQRAIKTNNVSQVRALIESHYGGGRCTLLKPPVDSHNGTVAPFA